MRNGDRELPVTARVTFPMLDFLFSSSTILSGTVVFLLMVTLLFPVGIFLTISAFHLFTNGSGRSILVLQIEGRIEALALVAPMTYRRVLLCDVNKDLIAHRQYDTCLCHLS